MILVTTSKLKAHIAYYIALVDKEDILITRNGKTVAKLVSEKPNKVEMAKSLFGIIKGADIDEKAVKEERRSKI
jgi:prevent-host-death family protein